MESGSGTQKRRLALIREAMPGVARIVAGYRARLGDGHVTECVRRGLAGEPGWFFAREGTVAVGTPWADDCGLLRDYAAAHIGAPQALVVMREPVAP